MTKAGSNESAKARVRAEMRAVRRSIQPEERARRGEIIVAGVLSLPEVQGCESVMAFSSFGSEVPTPGLLAALQGAGVTTLLPFLAGGELHVTDYRPGEPLAPTAYGPAEPVLRRPIELRRVGVIVTPGLAFDRRGGRLGYGGGYYDRFLRSLQTAPALVAVAFAEQVVDEVPVEEGDVRVDVIVTDREVIRCRPGCGPRG